MFLLLSTTFVWNKYLAIYRTKFAHQPKVGFHAKCLFESSDKKKRWNVLTDQSKTPQHRRSAILNLIYERRRDGHTDMAKDFSLRTPVKTLTCDTSTLRLWYEWDASCLIFQGRLRIYHSLIHWTKKKISIFLLQSDANIYPANASRVSSDFIKQTLHCDSHILWTCQE